MHSQFEILAVDMPPFLVQLRTGFTENSVANTTIALAAAQAGYTGIVDLTSGCISANSLLSIITQASAGKRKGTVGFRIGVSQLEELIETFKSVNLPCLNTTIIVVPDKANRQGQIAAFSIAEKIEQLKNSAQSKDGAVKVLFEVVSLREANLVHKVHKLPIDGIIAKGSEASGFVGESTAFVLAQECVQQLDIPIYVWGGIGIHTAAACYAIGARGVVLDSQLLLTRESQIPIIFKSKIEQFDGSETQIHPLSIEEEAGDNLGIRLYARPGQNLSFSTSGVQIEAKNDLQLIAQNIIAHNTATDPTHWVLPLGQDVAFARSLAQKYLSVAGILQAIETSAAEHLKIAKALLPLAADSPLAKSHGTKYPIVQGAMTRVSDKAQFAYDVAKAGGLPFLALALMRGAEAEKLLAESQALLKDLSWGVGILGFVPNELRQEQMAALTKYKPPYVLIAGGRPDQAKSLEEIGIKTYLHVPSPLLLDSFIEMGSRRFIFEGRECGGHIGPRSSFVLWEAMIEQLLNQISPREDASAYHVLFAGGIHDAHSAAAVSALAAPLAARGVRVGVLMGTAYLFTEEAVSSGAIVKKFQQAALECEQTVLLETGPGHAIRCINSPYKRTFDEKHQFLIGSGKSKEEIREELELMNLGRLRLASKGLIRKNSLENLAKQDSSPSASNKKEVIAELIGNSSNGHDKADGAHGNKNKDELEQISEDKQWHYGMYMIGQIASLHNDTFTIAQLHDNVSSTSTELLQSLSDEKLSGGEQPGNGSEREPIAIVGMSCLFPKAKDLHSYWHNILNKVDAIEEVPISQWDWRNYYDTDPQARDKIYSKWGGFLEDVEFDATKYGIPPSSLASVDPMQLLLLEVTDAALRDAGYEKKPFPKDRTSVILANAGHGPITALYSLRSMLGWKLAHLDPSIKAELEASLPEWTEDSFAGYLGNVTAGRVANRFDLGGVNFSIDAACASSLAALYTAVGELRNGNSDVVFLAATDTHNQPGDYLSFSKTHAFSADGHCKTFDANADGIVISEGMAMLVLKRLSDAERDGDRIYAVIKGIGGSSDGRDLSLTAPRPAGQIKALVRAYEDANIDPSTVTLIEAHGTGTVAGDKAEVEALKQVFNAHNAPTHSCAIGSVKTMIGHTKAAAGLASLIKVAKSLHHKILPPTIGVKTPNPACHFEDGPFYINSESRPWILSSQSTEQENERIRRAGVSAFGFGGTNFHTVLEEYIPVNKSLIDCSEEPTMPAELFIFAGNGKTDIIRSIASFTDRLDKVIVDQTTNDKLMLASLAYWQFLRSNEHKDHNYCLAIVASSIEDLKDKLNRSQNELERDNKENFKDPRGIYLSRRKNKNNKIAFLFPGQGSQYPGMLSQLAMRYAEVRHVINEANQLLATRLPKSLSEYIYPPPTFDQAEEQLHKERLTDTRVAQPALGAVNTAMFALLKNFAVKPQMLAGHSYGEYVALCTSGYINFSDLMSISAQRGEVLAEANTDISNPGAMAAVSCSAEELFAQLPDLPSDISIANFNGPKQTVIAGYLQNIEKALQVLQEKGFTAKRIPVSQAFHTKSMSLAADKLHAALEGIKFGTGSVDIYSNLGGRKYKDESLNIPAQLKKHTVEPVDFVKQINNMYADGARIFVEVGPGSVLTNLVQSILENNTDVTCISTVRQGRDEITGFLHALGQLAVSGAEIDLQRLYQYRSSVLQEVLEHKKVEGKKLVYMVNSATVMPKGKKALTAAVQKPVAGEKEKISANLKANTMSTIDLRGEELKNTGSVNLKAINSSKTSLDLRPANTNGGKPAVTGDQTDQIMLQFQQTMQQMANDFLETQQRVMMAYLASKNGHQPQTHSAQTHSVQATSLQAHAIQTNAMATTVDAVYLNNDTKGDATTEVDIFESDNGYVDNSSVDIAQAEPDTDELINTLLEIVAERTGYPIDMIDPNLDLEADLGIDSIKRVEILNKFRRVLPETKQKQLEAGIEELAGTKTLQGIIDWLRANQTSTKAIAESTAAKIAYEPENGNGGNGKHHIANQTFTVETHAGTNGNGSNSIIRRATVASIDLPEISIDQEQLNKQIEAVQTNGKLVLITANEGELANNLSTYLAEQGFIPAILKHSEHETVDKSQAANFGTVCSANLLNYEQVDALLSQLQNKYGNIVALFHLQSVNEPSAESNRAASITLLHLLKYFSLNPVENRKIMSVTSMGGEFGQNVHFPSFGPYVQAANVGLVKVATKELPNATCKAIDLDSIDGDAHNLSVKLLQELVVDDGVVEVGYRGGKRYGLTLVDTPAKCDFSKAPLDENSIVLITGGARGITAEIAVELAKHYKATFILAGRSSLPEGEEDKLFSGLSGMKELKAQIIETLRAEGKPINIPQIESRYQSIVKEREIRNNLKQLQSYAKKVEYHSLDVRDSEALTKLIEKLYRVYGKIDAVIHGAGIIEDALIKDKNTESYERVFDTKVSSALTLLNCLKLDSLRYLFLFSSVVGRTGNAGQCDYVAANEVLNKLAISVKDKVQGRAVAILWGPWKGGMAQPELETLFAQYGWAMIDVQKGCRSFVDEMFCMNKDEPEVLFVAEPKDKQKLLATGARLHRSTSFINAMGDREYVVDLNTEEDNFLTDHAFDGIPVLPMAYALELMCEAARSTYPDRPLKIIEKFDIPAGIIFDTTQKTISIVVHQEKSDSQTKQVSKVDVSIISGASKRRTNFKARFLLGGEVELDLPSKIKSTYAVQQENVNLGTKLALPALSQIYDQWLFHGKRFQGIQSIDSAGEAGVLGRVKGLSPQNCLRIQSKEGWIIDPVMFDSAMQLGGIWARQCLDITALPTGFTRMQFFVPLDIRSDELCSVHVIVTPTNLDNELRCDLAIYNQAGQLAIFVEGLGGVGSKSLHRLANRNSAAIGVSVTG